MGKIDVRKISSSLMIITLSLLCMSCSYNSARIDPETAYINPSNPALSDSVKGNKKGAAISSSAYDKLPEGSTSSGRLIRSDHISTITDNLPTTDIDTTALAESLYKHVTIRMVGDILLHMPIEDTCKQEDGSYDFSSLFANTKDIISSADLALVN